MNMRDNSIVNRREWKTVYVVSCVNTVCYPHIWPEATAVYESWGGGGGGVGGGADLWDTEGLNDRANPGASRDKPMSCREFRGTYVKLYIDRVYMPYLKKEGV